MALASQISRAARFDKPPVGNQAFDRYVVVTPHNDDEGDFTDAAQFVKRLGNGHACKGTCCTGEGHLDDVAATNKALILLGLTVDPYPSVERPKDIATAAPTESQRAKARRLKDAEMAKLPRPDLSWQDKAACVGKDVGLFYPPDAERVPERMVREARAKAICFGCPVLGECLEVAIERREQGVWGGLSEGERVNERRRRTAQARRAKAAA